ncbi:hypothetical protein PbB2_02183 [Candidatus Phycosocius bacilliformis]|uniref:DUF2188 domain-containing protein n=1 Tax=Candidatus Phycosocius bacilliformis TaxID=1445552 RepID=A0A2P2EBQ0_9PROT|nr:DUF2188 domain-containing protein [Candidatus Phycosocius bacilliformis]GBF58497.1 hypothetical protein PbB2_02183 [Candidatus Phycosocius bacilliformis]
MPTKSQHVVPGKNGWRVIRSGSSRASSTHDTQDEAIKVARAKAQSSRSELYIHGKDGRIRERNSYGKDPMPPKG